MLTAPLEVKSIRGRFGIGTTSECKMAETVILWMYYSTLPVVSGGICHRVCVLSRVVTVVVALTSVDGIDDLRDLATLLLRPFCRGFLYFTCEEDTTRTFFKMEMVAKLGGHNIFY